MMKRLIITVLVSLPIVSLAASYEPSPLPYPDAPRDLRSQVDVSLLASLGVVKGDADGKFRGSALLNRAEFVTMVLRFSGNDLTYISERGCFPDVPLNQWYTVPVCVAKERGLIRGNARTGVPQEQWKFEPSRPVQYAEALKVLTEQFEMPTAAVPVGSPWYAGALKAAQNLAIDLPGLSPGASMTRVQMARLAAGFYAQSRGELPQLRQAERGLPSSSSSSFSLSSTSSASSKSSSSVSSVSSVAAVPLTDRSTFLRLGTVAPVVVASVKVFPSLEPMILKDITVTLGAPVQSVELLEVYGANGALLGRATQVSGHPERYALHLSRSDVLIAKSTEYRITIRSQLKSFDAGGIGGEVLDVANVSVGGDGEWSNERYDSQSTENFAAFETSRSVITEIANAGSVSESLIPGTTQLLGSFRFNGVRGDGTADLLLTDLAFTLSLSGGVTVSNPVIGIDGVHSRIPCVLAGQALTCSGLPSDIGSIRDGAKTIRVFGDIDVPASATHASLQLSLSSPGSTLSAGSVTWTDGTTNFSWVPFDQPVANGTNYSR